MCNALCSVLLGFVINLSRALQKVNQEHEICVCFIQHLQKRKEEESSLFLRQESASA
jgi:hypothetical protein